MKNITLSVDEQVVVRAREVARRQGKSLNALIRQYLESVAGRSSSKQLADELLALMRERGGHSKGRRIRREDAYTDRT